MYLNFTVSPDTRSKSLERRQGEKVIHHHPIFFFQKPNPHGNAKKKRL